MFQLLPCTGLLQAHFFQAQQKIRLYRLLCFQRYALQNEFALMFLEDNNCFLKLFFLCKHLQGEHADINNLISHILSGSLQSLVTQQTMKLSYHQTQKEKPSVPLLQNKERYHITFFCLSEPEFHHSVVRLYFLVSYVWWKPKQYLHFIGAYKSDCRAEYSFSRIKNHTLSQPEMRNINYYKDRLIRHFIYLLVS